jgi:dTDP-4-dehydrorhamnose 3,5-epimerase-like enzyme
MLQLISYSRTFGKWVGEYFLLKISVNLDTRRFCTWFLVMNDESEILYKATNYYSKDHERNDRTGMIQNHHHYH